MTQELVSAVELVFSWPTIAWVVIGILIGIVFGAMPGIGPAVGMAIFLPFSIGLDPLDAMILFVCIYLGAKYGGSIAAILINTPGHAGAAATTLDGYPLSRKGQAINALTLSAIASTLGGLISVIALILISPMMMEIVLAFGSPETFLIAFLGIAMITVVAKGGLIKGFVAGGFGLLITTIGFLPATGDLRYATYEYPITVEGIHFVGVLVGLFAIGEMIKLSQESGGIARDEDEARLEGSRIRGIRKIFREPRTVLKSSFIGLGIGAIPGAGASISNFVSYAEAMRSDDDPDSFGEGNERGVIASEAANSGTVAGAMIPTLSFGIPGSGSTAVLLGALLMHGLRPGPELFTEELTLTYGIYVALFLGNFIILLVGLSAIMYLGFITKIDTDLLIPIVVVLTVFGVYAIRNNPIDILSVGLFGVIGYYMMKHNYSIIALVLGVVLGSIAEDNLYRSLQISDGSFLIFVSNPLSLLLTVLILIVIFAPLIQKHVYPRVKVHS